MNQTGKQRVFYYPPFSCFCIETLTRQSSNSHPPVSAQVQTAKFVSFFNSIQYSTVTVTITVSLCLFNTMLFSWLTIYVSMESLLT